MPRRKITFMYSGETLRRCKEPGCGRLIFFVRTESGRMMPVDYETKESHFAHCIKAKQFRKKRS